MSSGGPHPAICWGGKTVVKLRSTKLYQSPIAPKGLELLLDTTFLIDPSQHVLLKQLKDHIDINYVVPTEMVNSKKGKKPNSVLKNLVIHSHRLWI